MVEFNSKFQDIQDILRLKWIPEILASIDSGKNSFSVILINIPYISETELNRKIKALLTRHLIQKNEKGLYELLPLGKSILYTLNHIQRVYQKYGDWKKALLYIPVKQGFFILP